MKVEVRDNNLIVFLNKKKLDNVDFSIEDDLELYFKNLFLILKEKYGLDISGSYNITVYNDFFYGAVLEIEKDDKDYFDYYDEVDMKVSVSKYAGFVYKLNGSSIDNIDGIYYLYMGDVYVELKSCSFYDMGVILEKCQLIYGSFCEKIKKNGQVLNSSMDIAKLF